MANKYDGVGTNPHNISTEHQEKGDAREQSDTLDRPAEKTHSPAEFDPAADVGNPQPGKSAD